MKYRFLFAIVFCLGLFGSLETRAQDITSTNFNDNGYTVPAGEIVWYGTTLADAVSKSTNGYVYLYNVKTGKFLTAGGQYGVHAVLSSVGMRLKVAQTTYNGTTVYTIQGRIDNPAQGDYMSPNGTTNTDIYMDRDGTAQKGTKYSRPNWLFTTFTQPTGQSTVNGATKTFTNYRIYNYNITTTNYVGTNGVNSNDVYFVNQNGNNNIWRFVSEEDYKKAMDNVTWGAVDLGSFLKDAEFGRDNKDGRYWVWSDAEAPAFIETDIDSENQEYTKDNWVITGTNKHWHQRNQDKMVNEVLVQPYVSIPSTTYGRNIGTTNYSGQYSDDNYRSACAQYYAAEIYNEKIKLSQELTMSGVQNLNDGLYKMTAQALYYDDNTGLTNQKSTDPDKANAYFFVQTETEIDGETVVNLQELPIIPMNKVEGNNITPHSGVSAGYVFDHDSRAYILEFYIELKDNTKVTLGIRTEEAKGWTVIGNVHLYAHGKQALFLDEDWDMETSVPYYDETTGQNQWSEGNPYQHTQFFEGYNFPATVYYNRTMTKNKWNTICLPIALTGSQVRAAFGGDCQLSEFVGITAAHPTRIDFKRVDLDTEGLEAAKPYIIKPTRDPDYTDTTKKYELLVGNGGHNHYVQLDAPIYFIGGVTKEANSGSLPEPGKVTDNNAPAGSPKITFEGTFYRKSIMKEELENKHIWMITRGDMYHLDGSNPGSTWTWNSSTRSLEEHTGTGYTIWGTYCYLHADKAADAKNLQIAIMGVSDTVTAIEGLFMDNGNTNIADAKMYNLSGQRVNDSYRGIVIMNGRKILKK
ncbi:MAG: hypothetical protein IJ604_14350 [Prevotella sp.]|nr:hypothetical protein [Prevotella sp.]